MKHLLDLPNQDGFRFIGLDGENNKYECVVRKTVSGVHHVYRVFDERVDYHDPELFKQLVGWLYSLERDCCGTFKNTPHRTTCIEHRSKSK